MGPPASGRVPRVRSYSGYILRPLVFRYGAFTLYGGTFQSSSPNNPTCVMNVRNPASKLTVWPLSLSLAATQEIDVSFSSSGYLDVSVPRVAFSVPILFSTECLSITLSGFPHSDICGSMDICSSPQLFAACHVLLRLPVPRHPPYALLHLTL